MNSAQESKNELDAAIRYAENAISSAKQTIESMEFRQQMAQKNYQEQTGREAVLESELAGVRELLDAMTLEHIDREEALERELEERGEREEVLTKRSQELDREVQRQQDLGQGYYDSMMTFKEKADSLSATIQRLKKEHAQEVANLKECLKIETAALDRLREDTPTMPVIPKDVAIAIFREGIATGVLSACSELEGQSINISEEECVGSFTVTFERDVHLDDELDFDWMRDKCAAYTDDAVIDSLQGLCADNNFECRIHGVDDQGEDSKGA